MPLLTRDSRKPKPRRTPQMPGVAHERMPAQVLCKQPLTNRDALALVRGIQAQTTPCRRLAFDDKSRRFRVESIGMGPNPAMLSFLEGKRKGVEHLVRAQPNEPVQPQIHSRLKI